jgi:hypothetical protein
MDHKFNKLKTLTLEILDTKVCSTLFPVWFDSLTPLFIVLQIFCYSERFWK